MTPQIELMRLKREPRMSNDMYLVQNVENFVNSFPKG